MRRYASPATLVFAVCLLVSLGLHLPTYVALGVLKDALMALGDRPEAPTSSEVEFFVDESDPLADATAPTPKGEEQAKAEVKKPEDAKARQPEEKKVVPPPLVAAAPPPPPPPAAPKTNPQAIQQKSEDPNAPPPPDSKYIAEENRRVEEETVASVRSYQEDDPNPQTSATRRSAGEEQGNDSETDVEDSRDREGNEERHATEEEAARERPNVTATPPAQVAQGSARAEGDNTGGRAEQRAALPEYETLVVEDGSGRFVVRVPKRDKAREAAEALLGRGLGDRGEGRGAGDAGRVERRGMAGDGAGLVPTGPDVQVSWAAFENAVDPETREEDRKRYAEEKRSRHRGGDREKMWKEFRAAIENFVPSVRPGNQTALNAAASPFAVYLAAVHRRIHREFADEFLAGMPLGGSSPFADPDLMTELEIILNRNGTVHRVGIVTPSGLLAYDYGAWAAVVRAQPYPVAPAQILSGDGRVYFHWGFYRNERQCGTFNAEPYILPNPPGSPSNHGPMDPGPMQDTIIPRDALPTWNAPGEREGKLSGPRPVILSRR